MLAIFLDTTSSSGGLTRLKQLPSLAKVVSLLFVEFLVLDMLSGLVDCAFLALCVTFLDLAVDGFPMVGCAVLAEAPFLELTLILAFAADRSGEWPRAQSTGCSYFLMKLKFASMCAIRL
jgi:hypothetical protein